MSRLVWDQTGEHWFENGTDHGVVYPMVDSAYPAGYAWNGLTAVTESPSGAEATDLWADNIKYATMRSAETYGLTIEAYTYPDEFGACDGSISPATGVYFGQQARTPFGFSWRTGLGNDSTGNVDEYYKLHIAYGLTASPSERSYETVNDSPDAITFSWEAESIPVSVEDSRIKKPVSSITIDSSKVNPDNLAALEDILYGSNSGSAYLPLPDAVLTILSTGQVPASNAEGNGASNAEGNGASNGANAESSGQGG